MKFSVASYLDIYIGRPLIKAVSMVPPFPAPLPEDPKIENLLVMKF